MSEGRRISPSANTVKFAIAALAVAGASLSMAVPAAADPAPPTPAPTPAEPALAAPGQPALPAVDPAAAPAPPPVGPPTVPEIQNPVYGSGKYGPGVIGSLRDIWHQAQDPYGFVEPQIEFAAPPPGAGPAPPLPPGYVSMNAPGSETPGEAPSSGAAPGSSAAPAGQAPTGGPPLPDGYYSLNGPPPPGYEFTSPVAPQPAPPAPAPRPIINANQ